MKTHPHLIQIQTQIQTQPRVQNQTHPNPNDKPSPRRRMLALVLLSLALLSWSSGNAPLAQAQRDQPPATPPAEDPNRPRESAGIEVLEFDREDGTLTLLAQDASRLDILRLLREAYDVTVVVPELEDARVTVRLKRVRLDEALAQILPEGAAFHFDTGEAEIDLTSGQTGERRGLRTEFPSHARPKGQGEESDRSVMKAHPERMEPGQPEGDAVKGEAERLDLPPGEGPKVPLDRSYPGSHGRLGLHIQRDGGVTVTDFTRAEGELVAGDRLGGSLIYAAYVNGQLMEVASMPDPLEMRSYTEEGPHSAMRADEGELRIALSDRVADPAALRDAVIVFYSFDESLPETTEHPLPELLTPETFDRFQPYLREFGKIAGEEILGAAQSDFSVGPTAAAGSTADGSTSGGSASDGSASDSSADGLTAMDHHIPVTELLRSGSNGAKRNLVIVGDGFQADDQAAYNTFVNTFVMQGVFSDDALRETMNAFNILRVNLDSTDQGVTQVDSTGKVTTARTTALDFRFSGDWNRCWMEWGPDTQTRMNDALNHAVPARDYVVVVLNEPGFGGCAYGNVLAITTGVGWTVGSHEMGHMVGGLGDEYQGMGNYTGGEPGAVNLAKNIERATLKWRAFVDPATPLPTTCGDVTDMVQDVGAFVGGTIGQSRFNAGIWRPTCDGRMNSNAPVFNPIGYKQIHDNLDSRHDFTYDKSYAGDFDGDGRDDVVVHNANSLALYVSRGSTLEAAWVATGEIPVWDDFMAGDTFYVGDFNADGKDDLFVVNFTDWAMPYFALLRSTGTGFEAIRRFDLELPGWDDMKSGDQFFVADFNADGRDDIYVFNGSDWSMGYFGLLRSTGTNLVYSQRYDGELPGWDDMKKGDQFFVADFNADGRDDIYVFNGQDWSVGYLEMLRANGAGLAYVIRYDEELPGWDDMKKGDRFFVADFSGDGRDDLYAFNGSDWSMGYLGLLRSRGTSLGYSYRYDGEVPGWDRLMPGDQFYPADVNGDGLVDLYAYNWADWDSEYLGILRSAGRTVAGSWQKDWINSWNLGKSDRFLVGNFNGGAGWDDLFIRNRDWFGLLRSQSSSVGLTMINPNWIHNHRYHNQGWW